MHASTGLPAALPMTTTELTEPSDAKVTVARETGSSGFRQERASGNARPIAPLTAPCEGLSGTLPGAYDGAAGPVGSVAAAGAPAPPTACSTASPRAPGAAGGGGGVFV